ncbi:MAG: hypothetical protein ABI741_12830 [Ferruginibacter sp.]
MIQQLINLFAQHEKMPEKKNNDDLNESIVNEPTIINSKIFSTVDLWNIQRKRKTVLQRRWSY